MSNTYTQPACLPVGMADLFRDPEIQAALLEVATAFERMFRANAALAAELTRPGRPPVLETLPGSRGA